LQSSVLRPSVIAVKPVPTRPANSWWSARMPVSMMKAVTPAPVAV
jgi:hypothetical protein